MDSFEDFGLKMSNWNRLNEYMKICEYKMSTLYNFSPLYSLKGEGIFQ